MSCVLFTGCANQVLYGTWKLTDTIDAETLQPLDQSANMFANMMVFTINKDKTVTFLDKEFGVFTKSRNEFTFTYTTKEGEEEKIQTGAWELNGSELNIWVDDTPLIYRFSRVEKNAN